MSEQKLTLKQTKFIKYYFESGNGTEAARLAKYQGNDATLSQVASENLRKPLIIEAIQKLKMKAGLSDKLLLRTHLELLGATKTEMVPNDEGELERQEVSDKYTRSGALKLAYQVNGKLVHKVESTVTHKYTKEELDARRNRLEDYYSRN